MTQTCISCTSGDREMEVNSKGKIKVRFSFLKALSQNFEVLPPPPQSDVINPKLDQTRPNWSFTYQY